MSEYQYYEFQALDRPLSTEAQAEMRSLSSRVHLSPASASFVYNYGDFRGDPYQILAKHFDAMLYITNWGTRQLMFRFPANAIRDEIRQAYQYPDSVEWSSSGDYTVLNIEFHDENGDNWDWVEGEGLLSGIVQVRDDVLRGDYRALYLAWLVIAEYEFAILEEDEDLTEPPVPPNLHKLSPALQNFAEFFGLSRDLVTAAAQASPRVKQVQENLSIHLKRLADDERLDFLKRLLQGEAHLDMALAARLRELSGAGKAPLPPATDRRTIRQLVKVAEQAAKERRAEEHRQAEAARLKKLEKIAGQEAQLWARIHDLIEQKKASPYDEAVTILKDLHDLAVQQQRLPEFNRKMRGIQETHPTLRGLHERLQRAGLFQR